MAHSALLSGPLGCTWGHQLAGCQVLLVRQQVGVELDHDADVLPEPLLRLGGELGSHAERQKRGGTEVSDVDG